MKILFLPHTYSQQRQHEKKRTIYPVLLAMQAEYYRQQGHSVQWGYPNWNWNYEMWRSFCLKFNKKEIEKFDVVIDEPDPIPFLDLPPPDRIWTNAKDKIYQTNGNFKYHPATYMQVANGCWWGKCMFCVEQNNKWEVRPLPSVYLELESIKRQGFKEVFDDSGTFPAGEWMNRFCTIMHSFGLTFSCNFRMIDADYKRMKQAGFRMLLFGLESANQETLDRIGKGTKVSDVKYIKKAAEAGLEPHIALMVGFPWETEADTIRTVELAKHLLIKGYAKTAQMSFYTPQSGEQGNEAYRKYVNKMYGAGFYPEFWLNKIKDLRNFNDIKYLLRGLKEGWRWLWQK